MAAYAALVSLEHVIHNLQHHSRPPISLNNEQAYPLTKKNKFISSLKSLVSSGPISLHNEQVHILTEKVTFLQEFLQVYNLNLDYSREADPLETRIARAAYAAEDAVESHIFYQLTNSGEKMSSISLYEALENVIRDMALIEKEAMEIKEAVGFENHLHSKSTPLAVSSTSTSPSSIEQKKSFTMVGADDLLLEMKSNLTGSARDLQTIPIVGMGGSGKTSLALNIYHDRLIEEHFDIRAWVTISQEYNILEILIQLLTQLIGKPNPNLSEGELGEMLHKHLYGRRFMIILDDMWSLKAWDGVKTFLPNNTNRSRIVITTRLTTLASELTDSTLGMKLLDEVKSWELLSKTVFGRENNCPPGFEEIGKRIGKSCKGLPLSIVVVGGLLAKSKQTREFWEHVEKNLNAVVNLEDGERCLKTLYMSYKQLPVHLKPCFLYMGIYSEDWKIRIPDLIRLWVAEGFLKPVGRERPEDVAREYLEDLIGRNLVMIDELGSIGSTKFCTVHDLVRDLCLREAQKEGFYTVFPGHKITDRVDRIVVSSTMPGIKETGQLSSLPLARFLMLDLDRIFQLHQILRLVRIVGYPYNIRYVGQLVNSRFFTSTFTIGDPKFPSIIWLFWNIHTLIINQFDFSLTTPTDFWYMSHLRHVYFNNLHLPDDPPNIPDGIVLANLQTLGKVHDFTFSEQVVRRIPNIRKLHITYNEGVDDRFGLTNLDRFDKLESLFFYLQQSMMCRINYPQSLKKLTLVVERFQRWQDMLDKIGELPLLEKLKLNYGTFKGKWETVDGQFRSLKFLSLRSCEGLRDWTSEASHFPKLEQLHLFRVDYLEEIPADFAGISTLGLIDLSDCSDAAIESAKRMLEEQEALYGEITLQIQVKLWRSNNPALKIFRGPNFHVAIINLMGKVKKKMNCRFFV